MNSYWLLLIPIFLVVIPTFIVFYRRRSHPGRATAMEAYVDGLRLLTNGDEQSAFVKFRQAVDQDTDNVDAYLKMGDIFRNRGLADKALQIHRELKLRHNLHSDMQPEIEKSLALDYMKAGMSDKAYETLEKLVKDGATKSWAAEKLLNLYTRDRKWKEACELYENVIRKSVRADGASTLASFKVMVGRDLNDDGEFHKARLMYKEAISLNKSNPLPYLYIAESYLEEKRTEDGLEYLRELCAESPKFAHLGFPLLEETLFRLGRFGEVEDIYSGLLAIDSNNIHARVALAGIHEKKGELSSAESLLKSTLDIEPTNSVAAVMLVNIMAARRRMEDGLAVLSKLADKISQRSRDFKCQRCGKSLARPLPICPHCGAIGIFT
jgi:lipopolysaccharide biosynthesis regulator YciM